MAEPALLPGNKFQLLRGDGGASEQFFFVCAATTISLKENLSFDDAEVQDCDAPGVAVRVSVPKAKTWDISFSGKTDLRGIKQLHDDMRDATARNWQVMRTTSGSIGGGNFQGKAYLESLEEAKSDNGIVTFTASLRGQGDFMAWTATS